MRCLNCGEQITRSDPGVATAAFALCQTCIATFAELDQGGLPDQIRPALWSSERLETTDGESLQILASVARDLAAPFLRFVEAADQKLAGRPDWRPHPASPHRHCDMVTVPQGLRVRASSYQTTPAETEPPVYGVYLDPAWKPTWPHRHVSWPDFALPDDRADFLDACESLLGRAAQGQLVEVGCLGGHGRTGTTLAVMVALLGRSGPTAVQWVRANYCPDAVETPEQEQFVTTFEPL